MTHHEVAQVLPDLTDDELLEWDWRSELRAQHLSVPWLARRTDRAQQTVYNYATGTASPPIEWLRSAHDLLRRIGS